MSNGSIGMVLAWCPGKNAPCDPCKKPPPPPTGRPPAPTTPGGHYVIVSQVVYTGSYNTLASVHVGDGGYTSGAFATDIPYPNNWITYAAILYNAAGIVSSIGQFVSADYALQAAATTLAHLP